MFIWVVFGVLGVLIRLIVFSNRINKMDSKIGFEMSLIVVEAIILCGRCVSFMVLTATVWEIFDGQTNSSILVLDEKNI